MRQVDPGLGDVGEIVPVADQEHKVGARLLRGQPFRRWVVWYTQGDERVRIERVIPRRQDATRTEE